ncbi:MAG TPA: hypothetical protein DCS93_00110 [Microscillaceae bacterium]|nr:hypothetical protein [Microscillaceae bacterium]
MKDYYKRLEIKSDATPEEIKKAYRDLSKKFHPDMHGGSHSYAEAVFKEIQEAYQTLSDENKRSWYDYELNLYYNPPPKPVYTPPEATTNYQYAAYQGRPQANQSPYRTQKVERINIFRLKAFWIICGIGALWLTVMFVYYLRNEGKGGDDDYAITWKPTTSQEKIRKYKLLDKYDRIQPFKSAVTWAYKDGLYELIDTTGKVLSKKYEWVGPFHSQVAAVKKNDKYGYIHSSGKELTAQQYDFAESVNDGIAIVQEENIYFILHFGVQPKKIKLPGIKAVGVYAEGLLPVQVANSQKWGFIDAEGIGKITPAYWDVTQFSDDLAGVKDTVSHLWGFINPQGKLVIPCEYEKASIFEDGKSKVSRNNKSFIIDKNNRCVADCK